MIYARLRRQSGKTVAVREFGGTAVRSQDNITAEPMTTIQQENYGEGLGLLPRGGDYFRIPSAPSFIGIYDVFRENGTYYAMGSSTGFAEKLRRDQQRDLPGRRST